MTADNTNLRASAAAPDAMREALRSMIEWLDDGNRMLSDACALDVAEARAALAAPPAAAPSPTDDEIRAVWNRMQDPIATVRAFL